MNNKHIRKHSINYSDFFSMHSLCTVILAVFLCIQNTQVQASSQLAPNFTLKSQLGENIKLSEMRGKVVLLNFWTPRCGICLQQFPLLEKLQRKNNPSNFAVFAIDIGGNFKKFTATAKNHGTTFPMLFDNDNKVGALYSVSTVPVSFLINRDGDIHSTLNEDDLKDTQKIQQIIKGLLDE